MNRPSVVSLLKKNYELKLKIEQFRFIKEEICSKRDGYILIEMGAYSGFPKIQVKPDVMEKICDISIKDLEEEIATIEQQIEDEILESSREEV